MKLRKVGIVGTGNMGEALVKGMLQGQICRPEQLLCSDLRLEKQKAMRSAYRIKATPNNTEVAKGSDILLLAVKPQIMKQVVDEISEYLDLSKLVISIAAGVPLDAIEACAKKPLRLIRVMPNICVSVQQGVSAIAPGKRLLKDDLMVAKTIFDSVGRSLFVEEHLLDAVTGLSGSGPAYIFLMIDALADAGVKVGLSRDHALLLASQTVLGAAQMLIQTGEHPGKLKDFVTSPGGTSITGLHALEKGGLRAALIDAVEAATQRSKALGEMIRHSLLAEAQPQPGKKPS